MSQESLLQDPLVGKLFLCLKRKNKLKWRGEIVAKVRDGFYLVQLAAASEETTPAQRIVSMDDLMGWIFFDSAQDREAYLERRQHDLSEED